MKLLQSTSLLRAPADENQHEGSDATHPDADQTKLTLGQRLSSALSSKQALTAKITQLEQLTAKQTTEIKAKEDELVSLQAKLAKMEADAADVSKALEAAEMEAKDLAAKEQDIDQRASEKAKVIVQGAGIDPKRLPAATQANVQHAPTMTFTAFQALDQPARDAFMASGGCFV